MTSEGEGDCGTMEQGRGGGVLFFIFYFFLFAKRVPRCKDVEMVRMMREKYNGSSLFSCLVFSFLFCCSPS